MEVSEFPDFRVMSRCKALNISVLSIFPGKLRSPFRSDAPEVTLSGFAGGETFPLPPPVFVSYGNGGFVIVMGDLLVAVE
jgi:hypothetical protein